MLNLNSIIFFLINRTNCYEPYQQQPLFSAHQLTLTLGSVPPLVLQFPWPFLAEEIKSSLRKKKKEKWIELVFKKSLIDPWPVEFIGRSKWDVNRLKPWKELETNGVLLMHLKAQFSCDSLHSTDSARITALTKGRRHVQTIFLKHLDRPFVFLMAIYDQKEVNPAFHWSIYQSASLLMAHRFF